MVLPNDVPSSIGCIRGGAAIVAGSFAALVLGGYEIARLIAFAL
jgi:hypothetical protein